MRKILIAVLFCVTTATFMHAGKTEVFISLIKNNYKKCEVINLTYLNGLIPAVVPIKTEDLTSLVVTGEVLKIFYKNKKNDSFEFYQALNSIYNVMLVKGKKSDVLTIFFGEAKFSAELSSIVLGKYKSCETLIYINPTLNAPIPTKVDNIASLGLEGDVLHIETKDKWSIYQAMSGLNYVLYTTNFDEKKNTSKSTVLLFTFGATDSKTIGNNVISRYKTCDTITSLGVPFPPISVKDVKSIGLANGVLSVEYVSGAFFYQAIEGVKNITIKEILGLNNMILTF